MAIVALNPTQASGEVLTRTAAVHMALEQNPEIIAARKEWEAAQARIIQARTLPDPALGLEFEELPGIAHLGGFGQRNIGLTQTLASPLAWWLRQKAAAQNAAAVKLSGLEMAELDLSARVKLAYDRILLQQQVIEYSTESMKLAQDFLQKAQRRLAVGEVSRLEVLQVQVEAGRVASRAAQARNELSLARAALNALLARDARTPLELSGDLSFHPVEVVLEPLQRLAVERRPDLRGADLRLAETRTLHAASRASLWPDLQLGLSRQTLKGAAGPENFWRVDLDLELPLWMGRRQRGEIAEARAEAEGAEAGREVLRHQVLLETESAYLGLQTAAEQVQLFQEQIVHGAEEAYEVARRSYQEGKASYLEVLEAQRALTETRIDYAQALFDYRAALIELERVVGGKLGL